MKRLLGIGLALALASCGGTTKPAVKKSLSKKRGVSLADLNAHAAKQLKSIEECYTDSLEEGAKPEGKVTLTVGITWEGSVTSANAYTEKLPV